MALFLCGLVSQEVLVPDTSVDGVPTSIHDSEGLESDQHRDIHEIEDLLAHDLLSSEKSSTESSAAPSGVLKIYLASVRDKVSQEMDHGSLPMCYTQGQFWIRPPDPYFALRKAARSSGGLNPDSLYHPLIFLWLPHLLDDMHYTCPMSSCHNYKRTSTPLTIKGWNDNPIA
jgi:hypothetical protein